MGVKLSSLFFGVDKMIKLKARQILVGRVFKSFLSFSLSFLVFSLGIAAFLTAVLLFNDKTVNELYNGVFSGYSQIAKGVTAFLLSFAGLALIARGKMLSALFSCRLVSKNSFPSGIKKTFRFLLFISMKFLFTLSWGFVFLFPSAVCVSFLLMSLSQGAMEKGILYSWISGCAVLALTGLGFLFVMLQRYSAWQYYLCNEKYGVVSSLYKSLEKTEGRYFEIALFKASMLGWLLSCLLVLPVVYVIPYYRISLALKVMTDKKQTEKNENENILPAVFRVVREQ